MFQSLINDDFEGNKMYEVICSIEHGYSIIVVKEYK